MVGAATNSKVLVQPLTCALANTCSYTATGYHRHSHYKKVTFHHNWSSKSFTGKESHHFLSQFSNTYWLFLCNTEKENWLTLRKVIIMLLWLLRYSALSHCIIPPSEHLGGREMLFTNFLTSRYKYKFPAFFSQSEMFIWHFEFGFTLRRLFNLALTVSCCEDKDVKLFCKFPGRTFPGLQVLPSFTRHDTLSIKLNHLNTLLTKFCARFADKIHLHIWNILSRFINVIKFYHIWAC